MAPTLKRFPFEAYDKGDVTIEITFSAASLLFVYESISIYIDMGKNTFSSNIFKPAKY